MSTLYPIGTILPYAGPLTPAAESALIAAGYIPCDGRQLSQTDPQYADLHAQISNWYGGTDKTFCVPDYRGRFLRGTDSGANRDPDAKTRTAPTSLQIPGNTGDNVGSLEKDAVETHTHSYTQGGSDWHRSYPGLNSPGPMEHPNMAAGTSSSFGGSETRPKNAYIEYLIVYM